MVFAILFYVFIFRMTTAYLSIASDHEMKCETTCCLVTRVYLLFLAVYDVTRRETFTNLSNIWAKEVDLYSTNEECIKILVGNKVDRVRLAHAVYISI